MANICKDAKTIAEVAVILKDLSKSCVNLEPQPDWDSTVSEKPIESEYSNSASVAFPVMQFVPAKD